MKNYHIHFSLALLLSIQAKAQTYISVMPAFYTSQSTIVVRSTFDIELGKNGMFFNLGLDLGKTNLSKQKFKDTTTYVEIRPNLNVLNKTNSPIPLLLARDLFLGKMKI